MEEEKDRFDQWARDNDVENDEDGVIRNAARPRMGRREIAR